MFPSDIQLRTLGLHQKLYTVLSVWEQIERVQIPTVPLLSLPRQLSFSLSLSLLFVTP